jgi:hypothetical protein
MPQLDMSLDDSCIKNQQYLDNNLDQLSTIKDSSPLQLPLHSACGRFPCHLDKADESNTEKRCKG